MDTRLKEKELELQLEEQRRMTRTDRFAAEEVVEDSAGHDYYDSTSDGAADPRAGSHSQIRASLLADRVKNTAVPSNKCYRPWETIPLK